MHVFCLFFFLVLFKRLSPPGRCALERPLAEAPAQSGTIVAYFTFYESGSIRSTLKVVLKILEQKEMH